MQKTSESKIMSVENAKTTRDLETILNDFGKFPKAVHYNNFGTFINKKNGHRLFIYHGTNCGWYWSTQCETKGCKGYGHNFEKCPHISKNLHCRDFTTGNLHSMSKEILDQGFEYIYCQYYFDKKGNRVI
jgi:hypothetical protein